MASMTVRSQPPIQRNVAGGIVPSAQAPSAPAQAPPAAASTRISPNALSAQDRVMGPCPEGTSLACMNFFATGSLHAAWDDTHDQLNSEMKRIDKIPGFKADINVGRLQGMVDAIETSTTSEQCVQKLAGELKKAGFGGYVGDQPSEATVKGGIKAYLDAIRHDFHLKVRN